MPGITCSVASRFFGMERALISSMPQERAVIFLVLTPGCRAGGSHIKR